MLMNSMVLLLQFEMEGRTDAVLRILGLVPTPPNVPLLRALWSLLDGIWGVLKGSCAGQSNHFEKVCSSMCVAIQTPSTGIRLG